MLDWLSEHQALVIAILALFGAGGAGTIIVQRMLKGGGGQAPGGPSIRTEASGGGAAVTHTGTGNVDLRVNETVPRETFDLWRDRLGLSRAASARMTRAMEAAGLPADRVAALSADLRTNGTDGAPEDWRTVADALERNDVAGAGLTLDRIDADLRRGRERA